MLLCVDIGNTTIAFAIMRGTKVIYSKKVLTAAIVSGQLGEVRQLIQPWRKKISLIEEVVLCSVVPKATGVIEQVLQKALGVNISLVGRDLIVPLHNLYRNPTQVGQDRLVGAFAALEFYGQPAIIVDLGTAITLDVVSSHGEYQGGIIVPGIQLSADALWDKTALLPLVNIKRPQRLIGKDTENSILSGLFYGYGEMLKGLIKKLRREISGRPQVVMTGGYARLMQSYLKGVVTKVDEQLIFKGLVQLFLTKKKR
jgi:type III pantothenate kinase